MDTFIQNTLAHTSRKKGKNVQYIRMELQLEKYFFAYKIKRISVVDRPLSPAIYLPCSTLSSLTVTLLLYLPSLLLT